MSGRESSSPSLLQSLKRFRFKKNVDKLGTDSGSDNVNSTTDSENLGTSENDYTSKTTKDGIDSAVSDSNGGKADSDGQSSNHNDDSESELVVNRKKNRLKVDDDSDDKNVDKESSDSGSELVIIRKKKRLKLDNSSDAYFNCDKSESSESNNITKNKMSIKNYFSPKVVNDSSNNYKQNKLKTSVNSDTSESNNSLKPNHHSNEDSDKIIISSDDSNNDNDGDVDCKMPSSSSNKGKNKESKKKKKKSKKRKRKGSDNDSDDVAVEGHVYDSEADSDEEISNEMSGMKSEVFNFLNTAPEEELKEVKCSIKKIKALIEARPFAGWIHLVNTCLLNRGIGTEILNATQDLLTARAVLDKLMNRCERISKRTALAISDGKTNIVKQPEILTSCMHLKSYQMIGLNWLAVMHSQNISGILADEMGLGKTIQVIAFLAYLKERGHAIENSPHLIVVPSSTLENWCNEFKKWCPSLNVARYHGSQDERRTLRFNWVKYGFNGIDVILSTYQAVSGIYEDKKLFRVVSLHYAIFDEGHMLKNMNTQRYDNIFKINAKFKLLLTGTPVQNSLLELMSLLMFVMPEMFASWKEHIKFLFERKKGGVHDQVKYERDNVELVKKIMKPFILRRLKVDVLQDLPTKTSSIIECPLVESQAIKYAELLNQYKQSAAERDIGARTSYMSMFTDLRRMANHPLLLRYLYEDDQLTEMADLLSNDYDYKENDKEKIFEDLLYLSDHQLHKLTETHKCLKKFSLPDSVFLESGKFVKLDEILPDLQTNNHRLLIFSQFIFILDILEEYLRIRDYSYVRIDGSTPVLERQQLIDLYNMDNQIFVFLLSTKAGGMGINLTSADTVIINDVDFNPYNDKQAEDRCHRVGQTRDVKIIRLVAKDTIEETIFKVAQEKASLGHEVTATDGEVEEQKDMVSLLHSVLGIQNTT